MYTCSKETYSGVILAERYTICPRDLLSQSTLYPMSFAIYLQSSSYIPFDLPLPFHAGVALTGRRGDWVK